jgi:hypothetical protein
MMARLLRSVSLAAPWHPDKLLLLDEAKVEKVDQVLKLLIDTVETKALRKGCTVCQPEVILNGRARALPKRARRNL